MSSSRSDVSGGVETAVEGGLSIGTCGGGGGDGGATRAVKSGESKIGRGIVLDIRSWTLTKDDKALPSICTLLIATLW